MNPLRYFGVRRLCVCRLSPMGRVFNFSAVIPSTTEVEFHFINHNNSNNNNREPCNHDPCPWGLDFPNSGMPVALWVCVWGFRLCLPGDNKPHS